MLTDAKSHGSSLTEQWPQQKQKSHTRHTNGPLMHLHGLWEEARETLRSDLI